MITITAYGIPAPQGSKRFVGVSKKGRGILVESSAKVKPWRQSVMMAAVEAGARVVGPVAVSMTFTLPRPAAAKKRAHHATKPDLSKLVRSTEDSITDAGLWEDDSRVCRTTSEKLYVGAEGALASPGAALRLLDEHLSSTGASQGRLL